jgi:hypothetical protein
LVSGSLGQFDIAVSRKFIQHEAMVDDLIIDDIIRVGLLRRKGEYFTLGHRSLCALLVEYLSNYDGWKDLNHKKGPNSSVNVVLDYLKSLGSSLAVDSLRAIQKSAGFKELPQLNRRASTIVEIWQTFNSLVERIEQQQHADATWGNTPASAMFALQAFSEIGRPKLGEKSINFLRAHWKIKSGRIKCRTSGFATKHDFEQIQGCMLEEDKIMSSSWPKSWAPTNEIEINRIHETWVLGIILCVEACAEVPFMELSKLASYVEREQSDDGSFYPSRVPWVTARVLLGLAACGRTIDTSENVRSAVNWLLKDESMGGPFQKGVWHSGTGKWNSTVETTGMVLLALSAVGYDCTNDKLDQARSLLQGNLDKWKAGNELDEALSIQAYLETGGNWEDVAHYSQQLSQWARGEAFWSGARRSAKDSFDQSCRVAQIASHLIHIGWTAIRSDLPAFLEALASSNTFKIIIDDQKATIGTADVKVNQALPVHSSAIDSSLLSLKKIEKLILADYTVVGNYRRFDDKTRNELKNWCLRIKNALLSQSLKGQRQNFLIWASPGSGKSFLIQELARSLHNTISYIELNLARQSKEEFINDLDKVRHSQLPTLCLIDEVDARSGETWPYEDTFSLLDINSTKQVPTVFVLIGSSSVGLQGMLKNMADRSKGKDLLDRVSADNRFEISGLSSEDRVIIVASQVLAVAIQRGQHISEIEKLAFYYILKNQDLQTPRQLQDLASNAVSRLSGDDTRLNYDDLFYRGDSRNQKFWTSQPEAANELSQTFMKISDK